MSNYKTISTLCFSDGVEFTIEPPIQLDLDYSTEQVLHSLSCKINNTNLKITKKGENKMNKENTTNAIAEIFIFRNKLNALFGDDPDFTIFEVNQPLPDGTIERRDDGATLNILCSDVNKLIILKDKLGDYHESSKKLYIDYYYGNTNKGFTNIEDRPGLNLGSGELNTNLDIAMLFEGNPHFSRFFSNWGQIGPVWCVVFQPELIQYFDDNGTSLKGWRSCAMEDIARDIFPEMRHYKIYFGTEKIAKDSFPHLF